MRLSRQIIRGMMMNRKYYEYEPRDEERIARDILREPLRTVPERTQGRERCADAPDPRTEDYGINRDIYLTAAETAELYSISRSEVYQLAEEAGAVKRGGGRLWINRNTLDKFLENFRL